MYKNSNAKINRGLQIASNYRLSPTFHASVYILTCNRKWGTWGQLPLISLEATAVAWFSHVEHVPQRQLEIRSERDKYISHLLFHYCGNPIRKRQIYLTSSISLFTTRDLAFVLKVVTSNPKWRAVIKANGIVTHSFRFCVKAKLWYHHNMTQKLLL